MLSIDEIVKLSLYIGYNRAAEGAFDAGLIFGAYSETEVPANRALKQYNSISAVGDDFATTTDIYKAAVLYFNQVPAPKTLYIGLKGSDKDTKTVIQPMIATGKFWGVYVVDLAADDVDDIDAMLATAGKGMLFWASTEAYSTFVGESSAMSGLFASKTRRTCAIWGSASSDAAAVMGRVIGLGSASSKAFSTCYKTINGIDTKTDDSTQVTGVKALNANVYVTRGYNHKLFEQGTTPSGMRVDEVYYLDRLSADLQEAVFSLFESNTKIPQTDEGSALIESEITKVLASYVEIGFIGAGIWRGADIGGITSGDTIDNGYIVVVDTYANQSQADREAHKAMPFRIGICMTGSVESVELTVYAQR